MKIKPKVFGLIDWKDGVAVKSDGKGVSGRKLGSSVCIRRAEPPTGRPGGAELSSRAGGEMNESGAQETVWAGDVNLGVVGT